MNSNLDAWNIKTEDFYHAQTERGKIGVILRYGLLAPSTHNTQPWLFKIDENICYVYVNPKLKLVEADPDQRNLYISFGCLFENIYVAANYFGVDVVFNYSKQMQTEQIARIEFNNLMAPQKSRRDNSYLNAILDRYTYRGLFSNYTVSQNIIDKLLNIEKFPGVDISVITKESEINNIAEITNKSLLAVANKKEFRVELSKWMNSSYSDKRDGIPGYAYGFPPIVSLLTPKLMAIANPSVMMAKKTTDTILSASLACIVTTRSNNIESWIHAGRLVERAILLLVSNGLKVSISVAAIQDSIGYKALKKQLMQGGEPQFLFFAGYSADSHKPTPRYLLEDKMIVNTK